MTVLRAELDALRAERERQALVPVPTLTPDGETVEWVHKTLHREREHAIAQGELRLNQVSEQLRSTFDHVRQERYVRTQFNERSHTHACVHEILS